MLQSMYKSFCIRQRRGEFDLAGRDALWSLLVTITLRKAGTRPKGRGGTCGISPASVTDE